MPALGALESGNPDSEDEAHKAAKRAARMARFNNKLEGNRYKELEEARTSERKAYEQQGLISAGKTELGEAVDMRGTCERMCSTYEAEFREFTKDMHPLETRVGDSRRIDHDKAVAAYTRSDAGAGHGEAAKLPSDLRTPVTLARTLDYLFSIILPLQSEVDHPTRPTARTALGYTAGFIRDRTRAIRKEFAMQSSWGHAEAIDSFERIARWHILCLRELQEETGMNTDMHIDSTELGRCLTSLKQHYDDRRDELGVDLPCPNEPEFRAYMLIFDLTNKNASIAAAEAPSEILDHPNVQLAWQLRRAAQRSFDTQKEGSKQNADLGANLITTYTRLLKSARMPYLLSCLAEVRLREMRRSALRAMQRTYARLPKGEPVRRNEEGQIVERRMVLMHTFEALMGCEEQEREASAWEDVPRVEATPHEEAAEIAKRFGLEVYEEAGQPVGIIVNSGSYFDDNKDAPYTRRWKLVTDKQASISYTDIINGRAGTLASADVLSQTPAFARGGRQQHAASSSSFQQARPLPSAVIAPVAASNPFISTNAVSIPAPQRPFAPLPAAASALSHIAPIAPIAKAPPFSFSVTPATPSLDPSHAAPAQAKRPAFSFESTPQATAAAPVEPLSTAVPAPAGPSKFNFSFSTPKPASTGPLVQPETSSILDILSRPSSFAASSPAVPAQFPSLVTAPPQPLASSSSSALSQSTIATPRKVSLRSLTRSTSRATGSPEQARLHQSHRQEALSVGDALIDEVLRSLIGNITPDISQAVRNEIAAREYTDRKGKRKEVIAEWSEGIVDRLLVEIVEEVTKEAMMREMIRRSRVRRTADHWVEWTHEREEEREEVEKDRKEVWESLRDMGLGKSGESVMRDSVIGEGSVRFGEMELDNDLHEAERDRERFYAPSTFLHNIARHTSPILARHQTYDGDSPRFEVLLSSSAHAAPSPPPSSRKWLKDKLQPKHADSEWWFCEGVDYACRVKSRDDELPERELSRVGLVLLEVPTSTALKQDRDNNTADVHDRLTAIAALRERESTAYRPGLIILSWQEETLEDVIDRLALSAQLKEWSNVRLMCLSSGDELDARFEEAVKSVLQPDLTRTQVILRLEDAALAVDPAWRRWLDSTALLLRSEPENAKLALMSFRAGISLLNTVTEVVQTWLKANAGGSLPISSSAILPVFEPGQAEDIPSAVLQLETYLEHELFSNLQDVQLAASLLHPAAMRNKPLPISTLLSAIATYSLGELSAEHHALELYGDASWVEGRQADYVSMTARDFAQRVESASLDLASLVRAPTPTKVKNTTTPTTSSTPDRKTKAGKGGRPLKRPASGEVSPASSKESKSSKNARLLSAIRAVEQSLQDMDGYDGASMGPESNSDGGAFERMRRAESEAALSY